MASPGGLRLGVGDHELDHPAEHTPRAVDLLHCEHRAVAIVRAPENMGAAQLAKTPIRIGPAAIA